jgi:hypothetical protein
MTINPPQLRQDELAVYMTNLTDAMLAIGFAANIAEEDHAEC